MNTINKFCEQYKIKRRVAIRTLGSLREGQHQDVGKIGSFSTISPDEERIVNFLHNDCVSIVGVYSAMSCSVSSVSRARESGALRYVSVGSRRYYPKSAIQQARASLRRFGESEQLLSDAFRSIDYRLVYLPDGIELVREGVHRT